MSADMVNIMGNLLPILEKYSEVTPKYLDIKIEKYNEGTIIKMKSDVIEVGEALAEILSTISKMNTDCKVTVKVEDYKIPYCEECYKNPQCKNCETCTNHCRCKNV